jgi:hypothetical protein
MIYQYSRTDKTKKKPEAQETAQLERWSQLLNKYNVMSFTPADAALDRALRAGYIEDSGLAYGR